MTATATATIDFRNAELATWFSQLTVFRANGFRPEVDGTTVTMSAAALDYLASEVHDGRITDEDDGYFDGTYVWTGGTEYFVERR